MNKQFFKVIVFLIILISCSPVEIIDRRSGYVIKNKDEISLLTYNIETISEKEEGKIKALTDFINGEMFDIVLFQELFHEGTRDEIADRLDSSYISIISRIDFNSFPDFLFQDAGLFMASKFPFVDISEIDFGDDVNSGNGFIYKILQKEFSRTYDFLANKSVLGAFFQIDRNKILFLITSHVQALGSNDNKEYQLKQIREFIENGVEKIKQHGLLEGNDQLAVILAGDFNVDAYNMIWKENRITREKMVQLFGFPRDLHMEFNGNKKEYTWNYNSNRYPRRFDYVFAYDSLGNNNFLNMKVSDIKVVEVKDSLGESISDHRGINARLIITESENKLKMLKK